MLLYHHSLEYLASQAIIGGSVGTLRMCLEELKLDKERFDEYCSGSMWKNVVRCNNDPGRFRAVFELSTEIAGVPGTRLLTELVNISTKVEIIEYLVSLGGSVEKYNLVGVRDVTVFRKLISLGASVFRGDAGPEDPTVLVSAAQNGAEEILTEILAMDVFDVDQVDEHDEIALCCAIQNGHVGCVRILVDACADPNARNSYGEIFLSRFLETYCIDYEYPGLDAVFQCFELVIGSQLTRTETKEDLKKTCTKLIEGQREENLQERLEKIIGTTVLGKEVDFEDSPCIWRLSVRLEEKFREWFAPMKSELLVQRILELL